MILYSENKNYKLYHGSMLDMLEHIEPNSIDSVVTDPPYELNFMNKGWDNAGISFQSDTWKKCYEVLKPGGYMLAFGGSRTFHRIACAIEDAGFEIRDTIMWIYGSGFPKSMNIGLAVDKKNGVDNRTGNMKHDGGQGGGVRCFSDDNYEWKKDYEERVAQNEWKGWGTCLKPSYEPIIVARKPLDGTCVDNVIKWGVGGLNIDECRVGEGAKKWSTPKGGIWQKSVDNGAVLVDNPLGRFPANTILTYDETDYEEVCGGFPQSKGASSQNNYSNGSIYRGQSLNESATKLEGHREWYNDDGSASRYFYCAKASKKDRDEGCQHLSDTTNAVSNQAIAELKRGNDEFSDSKNSTFNKVYTGKNTHPTVKPTELMQYLIRLVTPNGGIILDPFNGSGSTGKAAMYENRERNKNYKYIGIELTEEYLPVAKARIEHLIDPKELEVSKEPPKPIETKPINKEIELW